MIPSLLLGAMLLVADVFAAPTALKATRSLHKRSSPSIASGFTAQQTTQITDGIRDALELAAYVVGTPDSDVTPILNKYFNAPDNATVKAVFNTILGGDPNGNGNDLLGSITISPDFPDANGDMTCDDASTMAELRDWDTANPTIVLCDPAAFGHGGIGKGYNNVPTVDCTFIDPRVTWKMETLGSILLHEYTHWLNLVAPPLAKETDDVAYGPTGVRGMDKDEATNNADSYSWFATENLWTVLCDTQYGDPQAGDDDDPNCGGNVCTAPKGP